MIDMGYYLETTWPTAEDNGKKKGAMPSDLPTYQGKI
jgi:hypothetical protein